MIFASETVRILFHALPLSKQFLFEDLDTKLQHRLIIDAVMEFENKSEVIVRISFDDKLDAVTG